MQSESSSRRWLPPSSILVQFAQPQCIHVSKSLSLNMEPKLIGSHPHGSHGLHALESKENPCWGWPSLLQQNLSSLSESFQLSGLAVHLLALFVLRAIPLTHRDWIKSSRGTKLLLQAANLLELVYEKDQVLSSILLVVYHPWPQCSIGGQHSTIFLKERCASLIGKRHLQSPKESRFQA